MGGVTSVDCWVEGTSTGGHTSSSSNCIIEPAVRDIVLLYYNNIIKINSTL